MGPDAMQGLPPFPGRRRKDVPPRLLAQSIISNADQLIGERAEALKRREENKKRRDEIIARRLERVEEIRSGAFNPNLPSEYRVAFDTLRAQRIAQAKNEAIATHMQALGRTMQTRSTARHQESGEESVREVLAQLDSEEEVVERVSSESDYEDVDAGAIHTRDDAETEEFMNLRTVDEQLRTSSEDDEERTSGVLQKRHRKETVPKSRKSSRTSATQSPGGGDQVQPYLRLRYLFKSIRVQQCEVVSEEK